jgi:hypothetical protein
MASVAIRAVRGRVVETPFKAVGAAVMQGIPFGFAQGRLSTLQMLRVREVLAPLRCNEDKKACLQG